MGLNALDRRGIREGNVRISASMSNRRAGPRSIGAQSSAVPGVVTSCIRQLLIWLCCSPLVEEINAVRLSSDRGPHLNPTARQHITFLSITMSHSAPTHAASQRQRQSGQSSQAPPLQHPIPTNANSAFHAAMNAYFDDLAAAQQRRTTAPIAPHVCHGFCHGPELWLCQRCATPESIDRYLLSRQPSGIIPAAQHAPSKADVPRVAPVASNSGSAESRDGAKGS
jgi:hypothetical protein